MYLDHFMQLDMAIVKREQEVGTAEPTFNVTIIRYVCTRCTYIYSFVCVYVCMYVCVSVFMCVCVCIYIYIYTHTHIYIHVCVRVCETSILAWCLQTTGKVEH